MQHNTPYTIKPIYRPKKPTVRPYAIDATKLTNSHQVRQDLVRQMLAIDTYQRNLQAHAGETDFSLRQTFKEMIQTRRQLLQKISKRID